MAAPKPTVVLVPGAWHGPEAFQPLTSRLEAAGYTCVGVNLASVGAEKPLTGIDEDVEAIREAVKSEVDADRDVLVLMHSYGSIPAGEAVKGLDKASQRKDGGQGGVTRLVYCSAFALPRGKSLLDGLDNKPLPWFRLSENDTIVNPATPREILYNDITDEATLSALVGRLRPFSYRAFSDKTTWEPWRDIPATYLFCTADQAVPIDIQRGMVEGSGGKWETETFEGASHTPFASMPDRIAAAVRRAAGESV